MYFVDSKLEDAEKQNTTSNKIPYVNRIEGIKKKTKKKIKNIKTYSKQNSYYIRIRKPLALRY